MKKIKILKVEETNAFFDEGKQNNGGGYSQPHIAFAYDGKIGHIYDSSCGDFGSRYDVCFDGKECGVDYVNPCSGMKEWSEFIETHRNFIDAFNAAFAGRYGVFTEAEVSNYEEEE